MRLMPEYTFELECSTSNYEIIKALNNDIELSWDPFFRIRKHKKYGGKVSDDEFVLTRIGATRNSFRPSIYGKLLATNHGTKIVVRVKHKKYYIPIIIVFCFIIAFGMFACPLTDFYSQMLQKVVVSPILNQSLTLSTIFVSLVIILWIITWLTFQSEARAAEKDLMNTLESLSSESY